MGSHWTLIRNTVPGVEWQTPHSPWQGPSISWMCDVMFSVSQVPGPSSQPLQVSPIASDSWVTPLSTLTSVAPQLCHCVPPTFFPDHSRACRQFQLKPQHVDPMVCVSGIRAFWPYNAHPLLLVTEGLCPVVMSA